MPIVGIIREHEDNSYLLIAKSRDDNNLKKVDYYHESTNTSMTFKKSFENMLITREGKSLDVDGMNLFSGEEPFLFFDISEGSYKQIFKDAKKKARNFAKRHKIPEEELKENLPSFELNEAYASAKKAGYDFRPVNAKPRLVFGGISQGTPLPENLIKEEK